MRSKLTLTFTDSLAQAGEFVAFDFGTVGNTIEKRETWQTTPRISSGQMEIGDTDTDGSFEALQYGKTINLDYNAGTIFILTRNLNVLEIESSLDNYIFENIQVPASNWVTFVLENQPTADNVNTTNTVYSESLANNCDEVNLDLTFDIVPSTIEIYTFPSSIPEIIDSGLTTNFNRDFDRNIRYSIVATNPPGNSATHIFSMNKLVSEDINIVIEPSLVGATVNFFYTGNTLGSVVDLGLEFSLDDVNWSSSNTLTGQINGNYTVYIRDSYGCKISIDYIVDDLGTREPYSFISKANSINFAESVEHDTISNFKTDENTLAIQKLTLLNYCDEILFQTNDKTTIQFHTNYRNNIVTLRKEDGSEIDMQIIKRSNNLNKYQNLDCICYRYEDGKLAIYFETGNRYDENNIQIDTYSLLGNLPDFGVIGNTVNIDGIGFYTIKDVLFDTSIEKRVLIIDYNYSGDTFSSRVESRYDLLNFEVYEVIFDWSVIGVGFYDVIIEQTDDLFEDLTYQSENINVDYIHLGALSIRYFNDNNRDIFYRFGIEHHIRIPFVEISGLVIEESEVNIGDLASEVVEVSLNEGDAFDFQELTKETWRKVMIALGSKYVFINGVGYAKNGDFDTSILTGTNLYSLKAEMVKTNIGYNTNRQGQLGVGNDYESINIPAFITDGLNNLKE
tara:strand:- start:2910 stop:4940 length:2031 start_codon:yes stop_codon:yes gene_type:complete